MLDHDSDVSELPKGRVQVFSFRVAHSSRLGAYVPIFALDKGPFSDKKIYERVLQIHCPKCF